MNADSFWPKLRQQLVISLLWVLTIAWGTNMGQQEYPSFEPLDLYINPSLPRTLDVPVWTVCSAVGACAGFIVYMMAQRQKQFGKALLIGFLWAALMIPLCLALVLQIKRFEFYVAAYGGFHWGIVLSRVIISSVLQIPLAVIGTIIIAFLRRLTLPPTRGDHVRGSSMPTKSLDSGFRRNDNH